MSFRIRISRTPGPIERVHAFSSSPVTRYPRARHQSSDFQGTPAAFRLVPRVTARILAWRARSSTDRTSWRPIPCPWRSRETSMLMSSNSLPRNSVVTYPTTRPSRSATKTSSCAARLEPSQTAESRWASVNVCSDLGLPNPTPSSSGVEEMAHATIAGMSSRVGGRIWIEVGDGLTSLEHGPVPISPSPTEDYPQTPGGG